MTFVAALVYLWNLIRYGRHAVYHRWDAPDREFVHKNIKRYDV